MYFKILVPIYNRTSCFITDYNGCKKNAYSVNDLLQFHTNGCELLSHSVLKTPNQSMFVLTTYSLLMDWKSLQEYIIYN